MSRVRVALGIATIVVGLGIAFLWDPTECVSTLIGCPPSNPNCNLVYCSHQYTPLRLAIGVLAVVASALIVWLGVARQRREPVHSD